MSATAGNSGAIDAAIADGDVAVAIAAYAAGPVGSVDRLIALHARGAPDRIAVIDDTATIAWADFDARIDRIAASLQRDGVRPRGVVAIVAASRIDYAATFIATVRIGAAVAPLSPSSTPDQLAAMIADAGASHLFVDAGTGAQLAPVLAGLTPRVIGFGDGAPGEPIDAWLAPLGSRPAVPPVDPAAPFNIIYSSGTTGTPKGIVQSFAMRWPHNHLTQPPGYGPGAVAMISTPLYSNTTLVSFFPALAGGGTVVLMPKFDAPLPRTQRDAPRDPRDARAGPVSPPPRAARLRRRRPVGLPDEVRDLRPVRRRPEGRGAAPLARRAGRILRHDRGRRQLRARRPRASRQAPHGRQADARPTTCASSAPTATSRPPVSPARSSGGRAR